MKDILTSLDLWNYAWEVVTVSTTPTAQQVAQHTADTAAAVAAGMLPSAPLATRLMQDAWTKRDWAVLIAICLHVADMVIVYVWPTWSLYTYPAQRRPRSHERP